MTRSLVLVPVLLVLAAACDGDGSSLPTDSGQPPMIDARIVDARPVDAPMIDAPQVIDAPAGSIANACMHACAALGVCFMEPTDPDCVSGCSADLADCSPQQVQQVDACSTQACGDIQNNNSPIITCLSAISCIDM